jgi:hypothetical protein
MQRIERLMTSKHHSSERRQGRSSKYMLPISGVLIAGLVLLIVASFSPILWANSGEAAKTAGDPAPFRSLHFAAQNNFDNNGKFTPAIAGFNVADVSDPQRLKELPDGVRALVWVGMCEGITRRFVERVKPFIGDQRVFGFYLMDDPDPRRQLGGTQPAPCEADKLRAESDWLHAQMLGTRTFIVLMNLGTGRRPFYDASYRPEATHIDLFGLAAYPCRSEWNGCDFRAVDRYVVAAEGGEIPRSRMVPMYQAFGSGQWHDDEEGHYVMPTPPQEEKIVRGWHALVPRPVFDYAYSWGVQRGDYSLQDDAALQRFFAELHRQDSEQRTK